MSSLMRSFTKLAQSPQGKKLVDKAQQFANDPKTKQQVDKAKLKLAELRDAAATGGSTGGQSASTSSDGDSSDGPKAA